MGMAKGGEILYSFPEHRIKKKGFGFSRYPSFGYRLCQRLEGAKGKSGLGKYLRAARIIWQPGFWIYGYVHRLAVFSKSDLYGFYQGQKNIGKPIQPCLYSKEELTGMHISEIQAKWNCWINPKLHRQQQRNYQAFIGWSLASLLSVFYSLCSTLYFVGLVAISLNSSENVFVGSRTIVRDLIGCMRYIEY